MVPILSRAKGAVPSEEPGAAASGAMLSLGCGHGQSSQCTDIGRRRQRSLSRTHPTEAPLPRSTAAPARARTSRPSNSTSTRSSSFSRTFPSAAARAYRRARSSWTSTRTRSRRAPFRAVCHWQERGLESAAHVRDLLGDRARRLAEQPVWEPHLDPRGQLRRGREFPGLHIDARRRNDSALRKLRGAVLRREVRRVPALSPRNASRRGGRLTLGGSGYGNQGSRPGIPSPADDRG